ncbi:MAG: hypothetical protein ACYTEE_09160, partial [Planctomycetota bacterium]
MALVVILNPSHPSGVSDTVSAYLPSANTPDHTGNPDALINPDVSAVQDIVERKYWQGNRGGNSVVEMSQADKDTYDAWVASERDAATRTGAKDLLNGQDSVPLEQRAFADITKDEFNILRLWTRDFKDVVAAANNLADMKIGV